MDISVFRNKNTKQLSRFIKNIISKTFYYSKYARDEEMKKFGPSAIKNGLRDRNKMFLVARNNDKIVGALNGHYDARMFWVDWLVVDYSYRRSGIAESLMKYLEKRLRKKRIHKIWCDCRTSNKKSIALLKKMKFQEIVKLKEHWYKQDFFLWQKYL